MNVKPPAPGVLHASFNPLIRPYLVVTIGFSIAITIFFLPLAIIWFCGVGQWWARHYFDKLSCQLDERALRYRKGILVQVEKTIPLENIQDVTFIEGPLLRRFHLAVLKFETAGQSHGQANDMRLIGIMDAHDFRNEILQRREALKRRSEPGAAPASAANSSGDAQLAALKGIQQSLDEIATMMRERR
jgi:putative membrane protein